MDFVELRTKRGNLKKKEKKNAYFFSLYLDDTLKVPHLLFPSVQLNLEAGKMPEKESSGYAYLKIPLNFFQPKI
jgi:hypothetical protein